MGSIRRIVMCIGLAIYIAMPGTAQEWIITGALKTGRHWHRTEVLPDGRFLIIGGISGSSKYVDGAGLDGMSIASCEIFDPVANTTIDAATMLFPRSEFPSVVTPDGKILVFGGLIGESERGPCTNTIEEYDPVTDRWTIVGAMTTERRRHAAIMIDDRRVLIVGGARESRVTYPTTEIYDIVDHTTIQVADLPQPLKEGNLAMVGGMPVYVGGREGGPNSPRQRFLYSFDVTTNMWVSGDERLSMPAITSAVSTTPDDMVVCGGNVQELPAVFSDGVYAIRNGVSKKIVTMGVGRTLHAMIAMGEATVMVSGGVDSALRALSSTLLIDVPGERVVVNPQHRIARAYHSLLRAEHPQYGTTFYAISGMQGDQSLTNTIERLSIRSEAALLATSVHLHGDASATIAVSPNPVVDVAMVSAVPGARLDIIDMTGRTVFSTTASSGREAIDMHACPPGVYAVRMTSGGVGKTVTVAKR
ncbi:MAG: hypothetical protein BGO89_03050 [Candidatus Kapaibacterium thiocyanatum]|uniref:Secretion system C-terminal sorting domain-containing protein n=1 Tax=Candidatus Kapaibacterium thiocyanatum TaxID=1895771 RepID=A0A1M3L2G7_9BACT|nr:MAG: hypothetical protein BGO89_03050 ['Candidatus Kapabacteria' thiocyanatum]